MAHVFDPPALHEEVRGALSRRLPLGETLESLVDRLASRYPRHIRREPEWILNNAGGAMGMMRVLHASITEYLILFGSPIGTEGHSGRFAADDFFFIIEGEQWAYAEGALEREVYRAGDLHHLRRGQAKGYRMPDRCFALEYARGVIPAMLPFGFADAFSSTMDLPSVARTVKVYARSVVGQLLLGKI